MGAEMLHETIWFDKHKFDEAEERYQAYLNGVPLQESPGRSQKSVDKPEQTKDKKKKSEQTKDSKDQTKGSSASVKEIAEARRKIQQTLSGAPPSSSSHSFSEKRIAQLEAENKELRQKTDDLTEALKKLELRVSQLESSKAAAPAPTPAQEEKKEQPKEAKKEEKKEDSDSDEDLFGSDSEEDEEYEKIKQERLAAYQAKKANKPKVIAKSSILLDVKPWDDETDIAELEKCVRSVEEDGLVWGASKILPIAFGIKKLQISCVVEDDKVGTELLEEKITAFEDYVQSIDVVAFNKL